MPLSRNVQLRQTAGLLLAGGVVAAVLLGCDRGAGSPAGDPADPAAEVGALASPGAKEAPSTAGSREDEAYVRAHPWWRAELTRDDLGRLLAFVADAPPGATVHVAQDFVYTTNPKSPALREAKGERRGKAKNVISVEVPTGQRPDSAAVVKAIRSKLDEAGRRDGPGRPAAKGPGPEHPSGPKAPGGGAPKKPG